MTPLLMFHEFRGMTDAALAGLESVLVEELNQGPRQTVRLTQLELDILQSVMAERGLIQEKES